MKNLNASNCILVLLFLISLKFFTYEGLDESVYGTILYLSIYSLLIYVTLVYSTINGISHYLSRYFVLFFSFYPILNAISCYWVNHQAIFLTLTSSVPHLIFVVYFYLIKNKTNEFFLIKLLVVFALLRTGITFIEQFSYPFAPFAFSTDRILDDGSFKSVDIRNGFYRFVISDAYYLPLFTSFIGLAYFLKRRTLKWLLVLLIASFGLYMDQTRQIMASFILSIIIVNLIDSKRKMFYLVLLSFFLLLMFLNLDLIFGELVDDTKNTANSDNIRAVAYLYFLSDMGGFISVLFGNGIESSISKYGMEIMNLMDMGLYRCDVGIAGALHMLGVVFVVVFLFYYINVVCRNWKYIDSYLKMMLVSVLVNIPLIFPLYNFTLPGIEFFMGILFYLVDCSILKNKLLAKNIKFFKYGRMA